MRMYLSSITYEALMILYKLRPDVQVHILRSYMNDGRGTFDILMKRPPNVLSICSDSNTFHLTTGKNEHNLSIETYASYVKNNYNYFSFMFNYDIEHGDFGTEACWENPKILESQGINVIPVIQNLEYEVPYVIERGYTLVAIGSTRLKKMDDINNALQKLYSNNIAVHLFGIGSSKKLDKSLAWSADCSSFAQWLKAGRLIWFDESSQKEVHFSTRKFNNRGKLNEDYVRSHRLGQAYMEWLWEQLGLEFEDLLNNNALKLAVNAYYFWELENKLTQSQKSAGISFQDW